MFVAVYLKERTRVVPGRPAQFTPGGERTSPPRPPIPAHIVFEEHHYLRKIGYQAAVSVEYETYLISPDADKWYKSELWHRVELAP